MARLRQLPQIYLRGAIANETMRHLPQDEQLHINQLTQQLVHSPLLAGHRQEFIMKLSHTIGGDYRDDRAAAEQEFTIAVWRALIYLLHHTNYSFECCACGAGSYTTQRGRPKHFDRRYPTCPNCEAVRITDPGASDLSVGQFVKHDDVQAIILRLAREPGSGHTRPPQFASPIRPIKGDRKVADHHAVLSDPEQTSKFFGEFIWNYFRQALRENEIRYHITDGTWIEGADGKRRFVAQTLVVGPPDKIAVEEILSTLARIKYPHNYTAGANPHAGSYRVQVDMDIADVTLVKRILALRIKYSKYEVQITANDREITVSEAKGNVPLVEALVIKPQVVAMASTSSRIDGGSEDSSVYDTYHSNIVGGQAMQEDGIARLESDDLLATIRAALPDGAQQVLDILTQTGDTWQRFVLPPSGDGPQKTARNQAPRGVRASGVKSDGVSSDSPAKEAHIARFLGVSPKQVKQWMSDIRVQCLAHSLGNQ